MLAVQLNICLYRPFKGLLTRFRHFKRTSAAHTSRPEETAEISNQMLCVLLEEALLPARVKVKCINAMTKIAILATSLTMAHYFGKLCNAEHRTLPPEMR